MLLLLLQTALEATAVATLSPKTSTTKSEGVLVACWVCGFSRSDGPLRGWPGEPPFISSILFYHPFRPVRTNLGFSYGKETTAHFDHCALGIFLMSSATEVRAD